MSEIKKEFNGITIRCVEGTGRPRIENGVLEVQGYMNDYQSSRKADIYLDEGMIRVVTTDRFGHNITNRTFHFVYDYGVYNERRYSDMSVIKNTERINPNIIWEIERHKIDCYFGASKRGKEALVQFIEEVKKQFETTNLEDVFRFRNWEQNKELAFDAKKTKATLYVSTTLLNEFAQFLVENGFEEQAKTIKEKRIKAVLENVSVTADFASLYKKSIVKKT